MVDLACVVGANSIRMLDLGIIICWAGILPAKKVLDAPYIILRSGGVAGTWFLFHCGTPRIMATSKSPIITFKAGICDVDVCIAVSKAPVPLLLHDL